MTDRQQAVMQAQVQVDSVPGQRDVVALERQTDGSWRVCGSARSGTDGVAVISVEAQPDSQVFAFSADDWGSAWGAGRAVVVGDVIRPATFAGFTYRVIQAGQLGSTEPVWNTSHGATQSVGTAVVQCARYYRPLGHGPVPLTFSNVDPYWASVVSLLHFDGTLGAAVITDAAGKLTWTVSGGVTLVNSDPKRGTSRARFNVGMISTGTSTLLELSGTVWTLEFFVDPLNLDNSPHLLSIGTAEANRLTLYLVSGGISLFSKTSAGFARHIQSVASPPPGQLSHIALVRESTGLITLYFQGIPVGTTTTTWLPAGACSANFGHQPWGGLTGDRYNGFVDELRITRGVARYKSAFTPPVSAFPGGA